MGKNAVTTQDDARLLSAFEKASALVESGQSVHDAMVKVSRDMKLLPGEISVLSTAFNTGRQLSQFDKAASISDQLAHYELADDRKIINDVYPTRKAATATDTAVSSVYASAYVSRKNATVKSAEFPGSGRPREHLPAYVDLRKQYDDAIAVQKNREMRYKQARDICEDVRSMAETRLFKLRGYFDSQSSDVSLGLAEKVARNLWGNSVAPIFDTLAAGAMSRQKRAADLPDHVDKMLDVNKAPLLWVSELLKLSEVSTEAAKLACSLEDPLPKKPEGSTEPAVEKTALFGQMAGSYFGTSVGRIVGDGVKDRQNMVDGTAMDLDEASHLADLKKIRTQAMLAEMLNDPDDPISKYDPRQVADAFNEISAIAPRAAEQKMLLRPMLAKALQGRIQPFEVKELTGVEKDLFGTQRDQSTVRSNEMA